MLQRWGRLKRNSSVSAFDASPCDAVAPGAEGDELPAILIEDQVADHHPADAHRAERPKGHIKRIFHRLAQRAETIAQPGPDIFQIIGPDAVLQLVLPAITAGSDRGIVLPDQHGLDAGGAQFNTQKGPTLLDRVSDCLFIFIPASSLQSIDHSNFQTSKTFANNAMNK